MADFYFKRVFPHKDILEDNFTDEGISADIQHGDLEATINTCRIEDYLQLFARTKTQFQSSYIPEQHKQDENSEKPGLKVFRRDPFTGKMKCSTAGSYTPDDLHELSLAVGHTGEIMAHLGTNFMKTGWFKGDNSMINGLKTELKAVYDLASDPDSKEKNTFKNKLNK